MIPLYIAAQNGHIDVVNALLAKKDIDINKATFDGVTPLYIAAENGHIDIITRAAVLFPELVIAVATNPNKHPFFSYIRFKVDKYLPILVLNKKNAI